MNHKRKIMIGILILSSMIFLWGCEEGREEGTVAVKKSDKNSKKGTIKTSKDSDGVVGGGYVLKIEEEANGDKKILISKDRNQKDWKKIPSNKFTNAYLKNLPGSLKKTFPSKLVKLSSAGKELRMRDKDGDIWTSSDKGKSWGIAEFAGGDGTVGNPYQITSASQLWLVREHLASHFRLIEDLDLSEVKNFEPIGNGKTQFEGTFDGNGKKITNLKISFPFNGRENTNEVGFFGRIGKTAVLKNIILKDIDVKGRDYVGGLVGRVFEGKIQGSIVEGGDVFGDRQVGGLVGISQGVIQASKSIVNVKGMIDIGGLVGYNAGYIINSGWMGKKVTGRSERGFNVGGLVGNNDIGAKINKSYVVGNGYVLGVNLVGGLVGLNQGKIGSSYSEIEVKGSSILGGLVGQNNREIRNSYATGDTGVVKANNVGGLVGWNEGMIENTFAWGSVGKIALTSREYVGGLVGKNDDKKGKIIGKNYWQGSIRPGVGKSKDTKGPIEIATVIKKGPGDFKNLNADNTGWDKNTWEFNSALGYPLLKWQVSDDPVSVLSDRVGPGSGKE